MKQFIGWLATAVIFAVVGGFSTWMMLADSESEATEGRPAATQAAEPEAVSRDDAGNLVVRLDDASQQRTGLEVELVQASHHQPQMTAYGLVQEDPANTFTLRAPLAGFVSEGPSAQSFHLGQLIDTQQQLGSVVPRLGPAEQADLTTRLANAHAEEQEFKASLEAARVSLESKRQLNAQNRIVSDQALQEAEAKVLGERARLAAAEETASVLARSVATATQPAGGIPLVAGKSGRIAEIMALPGEAVESGQAILRLASFDRLIARVGLPAGNAAVGITSATVVVSGFENHPFPAERIFPAATADALTGGESLLLSFSPGDLQVQPGMPVIAHLTLPGEPTRGVIVPPEAVVRYVGVLWAYVKSGDDRFTRRELPDAQLTASGWFVPGDALKSGEPVVTRAAQLLLSQELKFQTSGGQEEEE